MRCSIVMALYQTSNLAGVKFYSSNFTSRTSPILKKSAMLTHGQLVNTFMFFKFDAEVIISLLVLYCFTNTLAITTTESEMTITRFILLENRRHG